MLLLDLPEVWDSWHGGGHLSALTVEVGVLLWPLQDCLSCPTFFRVETPQEESSSGTFRSAVWLILVKLVSSLFFPLLKSRDHQLIQDFKKILEILLSKNRIDGSRYWAKIKRVISLALGNKVTNQLVSERLPLPFWWLVNKIIPDSGGPRSSAVPYWETENSLSHDLRRVFAKAQKGLKTICINLPVDSDMAPVLGWFQEPLLGCILGQRCAWWEFSLMMVFASRIGWWNAE